jgi:hypothetical protein
MNVTQKDLELAIKNLNELSESGSYQLDCAYGGYKLVKKMLFGGIREMTTIRMTKKELYYTISAIEAVLQEEKDDINLSTVQGE